MNEMRDRSSLDEIRAATYAVVEAATKRATGETTEHSVWVATKPETEEAIDDEDETRSGSSYDIWNAAEEALEDLTEESAREAAIDATWDAIEATA